MFERIIVHSSATKREIDVGVDEIRRWHLARGFADIGYHFVIRRSGIVEPGRPLDIIGAHTLGHNKGSLGICMIGGMSDEGYPDANFTYSQYLSLYNRVLTLMSEHGSIRSVHGHRDFGNTACPSFDVAGLFAGRAWEI